MRPAISYYGGKQNLANQILPLIPQHKIYVQPFFGGGTIFFNKKESQIEHINDYDYKIMNLYEMIKYRGKQLQQLFKGTVHAQFIHRQAKNYLKQFDLSEDKDSFDKIKLAWSIWVSANMSQLKCIGAGFAYAITATQAISTANRVNRMLSDMYINRLKNTILHNMDAIPLIKELDNKDTFFYLDPPYSESNCGHYEKTQQVFNRLLEILPTLKGKYILSSYPAKQLLQFRKNNDVFCKDIVQRKLINSNNFKTECLTMNFNPDNLFCDSLF